MPVPQARFNELLSDIEPSTTTVGRASGGHNGVRDHLKTQKDFKSRFQYAFLSGSYARDTSIRPGTVDGVQEKPDVDIIVVTNFTNQDTPDAVLKAVCRALEDGGNGYSVERVNRRSVRLETWQADMDIVPVYELATGGYMIADRESGTWKFTNPPMHSQWSAERNETYGGRFKPLVKMFKWWRRINPSGKRPKGFVLEVLVGRHAPLDVTHYGEAFTQLLENIYAAYGPMAELDIKPQIWDPADSTNDILSKVTVSQWTAFIEKVRVYAGIARRAQEAEDMEEASRQWRRLFGERFKWTANAAKSVKTAAFASGPAAGGYTFPNNMAAPVSSKPRGFA